MQPDKHFPDMEYHPEAPARKTRKLTADKHASWHEKIRRLADASGLENTDVVYDLAVTLFDKAVLPGRSCFDNIVVAVVYVAWSQVRTWRTFVKVHKTLL